MPIRHHPRQPRLRDPVGAPAAGAVDGNEPSTVLADHHPAPRRSPV